MTLWAAKWRSSNKLDGRRQHLILWGWSEGVALFTTRAACREWIEQRYGYIRHRPDLRAEPHGWRIPQPVRVSIKEVKR
jgi:hypothetical protein